MTEVDGLLIIQAMDGPPRDSLDPEFLGGDHAPAALAVAAHVQEPARRGGFEAEVGVAVSDAAPPASGA